MSRVRSTTAIVRLFLPEESARARSQQEIAADLRGLHAAIHRGADQRHSGSEHRRAARASSGVQFVLQAPTLELLREALPRFLERAQDSPAFSFVDSDLKFSKSRGARAARSRQGEGARRERA